MRRYKTAPGYVSLSIGRTPLGWHIQILRWVFTTETE
jgi:hypothetical protein